MAAKTPVTSGSAGYLPVHFVQSPDPSTGNTSPATLADTAGIAGLWKRQFSFTDIDDGDTWASGIPGVFAVFWNGDSTSDQVNAYCSDRSTGTITFNAASANSSGYILVLSRG